MAPEGPFLPHPSICTTCPARTPKEVGRSRRGSSLSVGFSGEWNPVCLHWGPRAVLSIWLTPYSHALDPPSWVGQDVQVQQGTQGNSSQPAFVGLFNPAMLSSCPVSPTKVLPLGPCLCSALCLADPQLSFPTRGFLFALVSMALLPPSPQELRKEQAHRLRSQDKQGEL